MVSILEIIKKGLVVASSDNNEKIELAIPARSDLSDQEIYDLLIKIDEGPLIRNEENRILSSVTKRSYFPRRIGTSLPDYPSYDR